MIIKQPNKNPRRSGGSILLTEGVERGILRLRSQDGCILPSIYINATTLFRPKNHRILVNPGERLAKIIGPETEDDTRHPLQTGAGQEEQRWHRIRNP